MPLLLRHCLPLLALAACAPGPTQGVRTELETVEVHLAANRAEARRRTEVAFREEGLTLADPSGESDVIKSKRTALGHYIDVVYQADLLGRDSGSVVVLSGAYVTQDFEPVPVLESGGAPIPPRGQLNSRLRGRLRHGWQRLERIAARLREGA